MLPFIGLIDTFIGYVYRVIMLRVLVSDVIIILSKCYFIDSLSLLDKKFLAGLVPAFSFPLKARINLLVTHGA